jgi:hypothetical protein
MRNGIVLPSEYEDYRDRVGPDRQLWENNGWSVRGRDGATDYLLWASPYVIQGLAGQSYQPGRMALNQTLLIAHDADAPDELVDNDFIAVGWSPDEYLPWDALAVTGDGRSTAWSVGGRTMTAAPPQWSIDGHHAGVGTRLSLQAHSDPMWFTDPDESLDRRADRWWIANAAVEGTITAGGRTIDVHDAHGVHERHIHCGLTHDPVRLLGGAGIVWLTVTGPGISGFVMARPSLGASWAQFTIEGSPVEVSGDGIAFEVVRTWCDPVTSMVVGQTWRARVQAGETTIELDVQARARAYYSWDFLSRGSTMLYWWLCSARATVTDAAGRRSFTDLLAEAHLNRTFYRRHGSADD